MTSRQLMPTVMEMMVMMIVMTLTNQSVPMEQTATGEIVVLNV